MTSGPQTINLKDAEARARGALAVLNSLSPLEAIILAGMKAGQQTGRAFRVDPELARIVFRDELAPSLSGACHD